MLKDVHNMHKILYMTDVLSTWYWEWGIQGSTESKVVTIYDKEDIRMKWSTF